MGAQVKKRPLVPYASVYVTWAVVSDLLLEIAVYEQNKSAEEQASIDFACRPLHKSSFKLKLTL